MFFAIAPERAGCNAKLSFAETREFQKCMFGVGAKQADFAVNALPHASQIITSIDKIGRFCSDLPLFTDVALCHAIRDVNAGFGEPIAVDLCFEFGNDLSTIEDRLAFVESVRESCRKYGVRVGKCHSMFAAITALTVAVIGKRPETERVTYSETGLIILASKLGGFKEVYFHEQGHDRAAHVDAISGMVFDYTPHIAYLRKQAIDMADVSGFGLSGALSSIALRNHVDVSVSIETSIFFDYAEEEISCLQSDRPENVFVKNDKLNISLNQREISGPMLIMANKNDNDLLAYLEESGLKPRFIGHYSCGCGKVCVS